MPEGEFSLVFPAQLAFLAIYNPSTSETINDQIVFYTSRSSRQRRIEGSSDQGDAEESKDEQSDSLRQVGLAQAMVDFARNFSDGKPVDSIETDKTRVVVHELEENWWILASIDLTRLPSGPTTGQNNADTPSFRYSSREMCPPHLLIQHLRRAHSTFLLHQDFTLDGLHRRVGRPTFCALLERFWTKFAWTWDVLLSGNPAVDIYNGIKLSVGGELGVGVGEEEWGSGERAVLEDFVTGTEGLVDLVVSRFGDPPTLAGDIGSSKKPENAARENGEQQWLGSECHPRPSDGVIFSGVGAISRDSLAHVSQWMEWIYRYGENAYGVEDPASTKPRRQRRKRSKMPAKDAAALSANASQPSAESGFSPGIPRPLVMGNSQPSQGHSEQGGSRMSETSPSRGERGNDGSGIGSDAFMKVLTLGYGSTWSFPSLGSNARETGETKENDSPDTDQAHEASKPGEDPSTQPSGRFIVGLRDEISNLDRPENKSSMDTARIQHRALHVQAAVSERNEPGIKLQAVVYVYQPFIYTFLFNSDTPTLTTPSLYTTIHHHLAALYKSLSTSTSPTTAQSRIPTTETPLDPGRSTTTHFTRFRKAKETNPVYELIYDPRSRTIRSSIPNIPDLGSYPSEFLTAAAADSSSTSREDLFRWSRVESLSIHHRILTTHRETRSRPRELERTCKSSRGWWIIWLRLSNAETTTNPNNLNPNPNPDSNSNNARENAANNNNNNLPQEAFLIRKSTDYVPPTAYSRAAGSSSGAAARFFRDLGRSSSPSPARGGGSDGGAGKIVEGIGVDARRYVEGLLSLNR